MPCFNMSTTVLKLSVLRICELIEYSIGRPLYRPAFEPIILLAADVHEFSHARFVQYNLAVIKHIEHSGIQEFISSIKI